MLSWFAFAVLMVGRAKFGWRGRTAVRVLYIGSGLLLLAYVGSRFVLEVVLGRAGMKYLIGFDRGFCGCVGVAQQPHRHQVKTNKQDFEREAERQNAKKTMVSCAHCGVHLPQIEALAAPSADLRSQLWFCSTEHRQVWR